MNTRHLALLSCAVGLLALCASTPTAQQFEAHSAALPANAPHSWKLAAGLTRLDGTLWAAGPAYRARFFAGGVEYTPVLGSRAAQTYSLRLELQSIRRGNTLLLAGDSELAAVESGARASFFRADGIEERYDALPSGLEQSFVFAKPLPGDGDLVVRLALETELAWPDLGDSSAGLRFELHGIGAVDVGAVTGIDAAGTQSPGYLRLCEGALELVLPDSFLDQAQYPLVLDPLLGTTVSIAASADDDRPDVGFDASTGTYLVSWDTQISLADADVRAQRINTLGAPVGGLISVEAGPALYARRPVVGSYNTANTFFVAYESGSFFAGPFDIRARAIPSATGVPSAATLVSADPASEVDISVGSEFAKFDGDPILCLWDRVGGGIRGAKLSLGAGGAPQVDLPITVSTSALDHRPVVSKIDGFTDSWLVVFESFAGLGNPGLNMTRYGTDGLLVPNNSGFITSSTGTLIGNASLDAMGHEARWLLAYEVAEAADPLRHDVEVLTIALVNGLLQAGPAAWIDNDVGDDEIEPDVCWSSEKFFVAFADEAAPLTYNLYVTGINPVNCGTCESETLIGVGGGTHRRPSIATMVATSTGFPDTTSFVAWSSVDLLPPFDSDILGQALIATGLGGATQNLGGGCGSAGAITTLSSPTIGNGGFQLQLLGVDPLASIAILNISPPTLPFTCGLCAWDPFFSTITAPIQAGNAAVLLSVPCDPSLVGGVVETQWTVGLTLSSPCALLPNFSLSDRLQLTIGQ